MVLNNSIVVRLLKALYVIYILVFFKTTYSFHHPLEILLQKNVSLNSFLKHPVYNTGVYENKVCGLGHLVAYILAIWIIIGKIIYKENYNKINSIIWFVIMSLSFILNPNVFIYLLPILIIEIL